MALPMFMSALVGCSALHVHTIDSPWESNETSHWKTCKVCHEKFEEHEHTFNTFNDKCFICDYVDPLVHIDEWGEITSLTEYGKTKLTFDVPNKVGGIDVRGIGHDAFNGSQALTVKLNKELDYYYSDSFKNSSIRFINTEEELVNWMQPDNQGKIYKKRVFEDNVAMFDNKFYPTLQEAFDAVNGDDATVTLLREELNVADPIEVKHAVSLVSFYSKANLTCNFNIDTVGILYIPETINYQGNVKLILGSVEETNAKSHEAKKGNETKTVNTSGSLVFVNKEERPEGVNVSYTHSFGSGEEGVPAHGAKQIVNDAIVALPRTHFAFGTFTFNDNFKGIRGLTKYGLTVNGLNVTKVAENVNDAYVGGHAFTIATHIKIKVHVHVDIPVFSDVDFTMNINYYFLVSKGLFFDLTIGEGVKRVLGSAFDSNADTDFSREALQSIAPLISHLSSITIGPDVEEIDSNAFFGNVYLSSIGGSAESLKTINESAFENCYNLKSVELSHAKKLKTIEKNAFKLCSSLIYVNFPSGVWSYGKNDTNLGYFPYDLTPEKIAYKFANGGTGKWTNSFESKKPYSYTKSTHTDVSGSYDEVVYTDDLSEAMEECAYGGEIYISENKTGKEIPLYWNKIEASNLTITAAPGVKNVTIANSETDPNIFIHSNPVIAKYLILSNVVPKGDVTIQADNNEGVTKHTAGFAIRDVSNNDIPKVNLVTTDEAIEIDDLVGSESIIRGLTYEHTYGMFNFKVDEDNNTTYIYDTSPFGDRIQAMTIARQTEKAAKVILVDRDVSTQYENNSINITLSSDVKHIGKYFFSGKDGGKQPYDKLERVVCEEGGVETIGDEAFEGCDGLISVSLPNSVKTIGDKAFNSCDNLTRVNIPTSLNAIPHQCFRNCPKIESIEIPSSVTSIGEEAFLMTERGEGEDPAALKYVTFNEGLTEIGTRAFSGCTEISSLNLPKSLKTIKEEAFSGCTSLSGVRLLEGNELETIEKNAFSGCEILSFFYFAGNVDNWYVEGDPTKLDPEILSDEFNAATYLIEVHVDKTWQRKTA